MSDTRPDVAYPVLAGYEGQPVPDGYTPLRDQDNRVVFIRTDLLGDRPFGPPMTLDTYTTPNGANITVVPAESIPGEPLLQISTLAWTASPIDGRLAGLDPNLVRAAARDWLNERAVMIEIELSPGTPEGLEAAALMAANLMNIGSTRIPVTDWRLPHRNLIPDVGNVAVYAYIWWALGQVTAGYPYDEQPDTLTDPRRPHLARAAMAMRQAADLLLKLNEGKGKPPHE